MTRCPRIVALLTSALLFVQAKCERPDAEGALEEHADHLSDSAMLQAMREKPRSKAEVEQPVGHEQADRMHRREADFIDRLRRSAPEPATREHAFASDIHAVVEARDEDLQRRVELAKANGDELLNGSSLSGSLSGSSRPRDEQPSGPNLAQTVERGTYVLPAGPTPGLSVGDPIYIVSTAGAETNAIRGFDPDRSIVTLFPTKFAHTARAVISKLPLEDLRVHNLPQEFNDFRDELNREKAEEAPILYDEDLYGLLGLAQWASDEDIRRNYHRLCSEWKTPADLDSQEPSMEFLRLRMAYEVLTDPVRRRLYDREHDRREQFAHNGRRERYWSDFDRDFRGETQEFEESLKQTRKIQNGIRAMYDGGIEAGKRAAKMYNAFLHLDRSTEREEQHLKTIFKQSTELMPTIEKEVEDKSETIFEPVFDKYEKEGPKGFDEHAGEWDSLRNFMGELRNPTGKYGLPTKYG